MFYRRTFPTAFSVSEKREKKGSGDKTQDKWEVVRSLLTKPVTTSLSLVSLCVLAVLFDHYILSPIYKEEGSTLSSEVGIQSHSSSVNEVL